MLQNNLLCMTVRSVILIAYVSTILISAEVRSGTEPYLFVVVVVVVVVSRDCLYR